MGSGSFNDLYEFNTDTLCWSLLDDGTSDSAPEQRSYHAMTSTDDEHIYVFGGCGATRLADFHRFDKSTAKWTKLAVDSRIEPRGGAALCSYKEKQTGKQLIYCIGGFCGRELDNCFSYNVDDDKWSQVEPGLPVGLSVFALSASDHDRVRMVLHGGEIGPSRGGHELAGQFSDATYIYDGDMWSKIEFEQNDSVLPCARAWHASSYANGHFYIYGGLDQNNVRLCDLYEFTVLPATN
jgi:N-acetylneuraminic acid mutarotase